MICSYQDYAEEEEELESSRYMQFEQETPDQIVFPIKLHNMLSQVDKQGMSHVASWAVHGRCFLIHDKEEFTKRILATWFRQSKFASFQRQLNLYGFKRITQGPDKGGYYHELFLRGKSFLCQRMERVKIKGSRPGRIKANTDEEPDFYRMKFLSSEHETGEGLPPMPSLGAGQPDNLTQLKMRKHLDELRALHEDNSSSSSEESRSSLRDLLMHSHKEGAQVATARLKKGSSSSSSSSSHEGDRNSNEHDAHVFLRPRITASHEFQVDREGPTMQLSFLANRTQPLPVSRSVHSLNAGIHERSSTFEKICETHATCFFHPVHFSSDEPKSSETVHEEEHKSAFSRVSPRNWGEQGQHHESNPSHRGIQFPQLDTGGFASLASLQESLDENERLHPFLRRRPQESLPVTGVSEESFHAGLEQMVISIDAMFDMSSEFLSQYLPTAESLAQEDIFEYNYEEV